MQKHKNLKDNNKSNKGTDFEIRRLGVMMETMDGKIDLIVEQYGSINEKLDSHSQQLDSHSQQLDSLSEKLDSHSRKLDSHSQKLDSHAEMLANLVVDVSIVKEDVEFIKRDLKKKVDYDESAALERRVATLEKSRK